VANYVGSNAVIPLKGLRRPRVVAILKPQLSGDTIKNVLPILFTSESGLTFTDKIEISFFRQEPYWLHEDFNGRISCGRNPELWARLVKDVYVVSHEDAWDHQTLHWTEFARTDIDPKTNRIVEASPEYQRSEEVRFEKVWNEPFFTDTKVQPIDEANGPIAEYVQCVSHNAVPWLISVSLGL
jgi:hypothetical protein